MTTGPAVTVAVIAHGDPELTALTLAAAASSLLAKTVIDHTFVLHVDGYETSPTTELARVAGSVGVDQIVWRSRARNCASGHPSNNGHYHAVRAPTPYLLAIESDVLVESLDDSRDHLAELVDAIDAAPRVAVATRADDHHTWHEPLRMGEQIGPIRQTSRVSSHFLLYRMDRFKEMARHAPLRLGSFFDHADRWFNYEDWLRHASETAAMPLGYLAASALRVFHCDIKDPDDPTRYLNDPATRMGVAEQRKAEVREARSNQTGRHRNWAPM